MTLFLFRTQKTGVKFLLPAPKFATVAQLVEPQLAKLEVEGPIPFCRSIIKEIIMNKYERVKKELEEGKESKMKVFGNSMTPIIKSGTLLTFKKCDNYEIGDIVFCKCRGRFIDSHKITKKNDKRGYMISNNHGWENGWTRTIFGKVIKIGK